MSGTLLIEMQYLGPISYFATLKKFGRVCIEQHEHYNKTTYRNRCYIAGPNGRLRLSIPLASGKHQRKPIREVKISYNEDWQKDHWNSLTAGYRSSPYFEYYEENFFRFYHEKYEYLFDFNLQLFATVLDLLELTVELDFSREYERSPEDKSDLRDGIHPNDEKSRPLPFHDPPEYTQVFEDRHPFLQDLSIVDLLFNMGPYAKEYI